MVDLRLFLRFCPKLNKKACTLASGHNQGGIDSQSMIRCEWQAGFELCPYIRISDESVLIQASIEPLCWALIVVIMYEELFIFLLSSDTTHADLVQSLYMSSVIL